MKQVLMISYHFPPNRAPGALRVGKFAKYLPRFGWHPSVITPANFYTAAGADETPETPPEVDVIRTPNWDWGTMWKRWRGDVSPELKDLRFRLGAVPSANGFRAWIYRALRWSADNLLFIPDRANLWYFSCLKAARRLLRARRVRAIFSSSPFITAHLAALRFHEETGIPWLADFRDLWTLGAVRYPSRFRERVDKYLERRIMESATHLTFATPPLCNVYRQRYPVLESKSSILTNGYDAEDFCSLQRTRADECFRIVYSGSFYQGQRNPEPLLASLDRLMRAGVLDRRKVELRIVGTVEPFLPPLLDEYVLRDLTTLTGSVPHRQSLQEMLDADLLWLITGDFTHPEVFHSTKLFEYLAAGPPILAFSPKNGAAGLLIDELQAGSVVADASEQVDACLAHYYQRHQQQFWSYEPRCNGLERYERRNLTGQLAETLDRIT